MYLSKVKLNSSLQARGELVKLAKNGAYASHQLLWRLFTAEEKRNFLFREELGPGGLPVFYVLSQTAPQVDSTVFTVDPKLFQPKLIKGDLLAYKIRVNPTVTISTGQSRGKRHDVLMHAKYQAKQRGVDDGQSLQPIMINAAQQWFADETRLQRWGVTLDALPDVESYTQHKAVGQDRRNVQFSSADLQGTLTVSEPDRFIETLVTGIGKAKAFGCGLMLVRRI